MKRLLVLSIFVLFMQTLSAQDFNRAIGIRAGHTAGFDYRFYTEEALSFKILLATNNGIRLHGLMEFHRDDIFNFTDQLSLFYGGGVHGGYENWDEVHYQNNRSWVENRTAFVMGIDGIVGVEYMLYEIPISIGIEAKPYIDIFGRDMFSFEAFDFAFTIKYLF